MIYRVISRMLRLYKETVSKKETNKSYKFSANLYILDISDNRIVLNFGFLLCHTRCLFWYETEILNFPLASMLVFGKRKKATLKVQSQFWYLIEFVPQKDHLLSMFLKSKRNKYLGIFKKFYWLEMCYIIRSILLFSLRHLSWDICPSSPDVSFV